MKIGFAPCYNLGKMGSMYMAREIVEYKIVKEEWIKEKIKFERELTDKLRRNSFKISLAVSIFISIIISLIFKFT